MKDHRQRKIDVQTPRLRNAREARIYVIRLAAATLNGAIGDQWCNGFEDEESNARATKARDALVAELDTRADRLEERL